MTTHAHIPTSAGLCADDLTPSPANDEDLLWCGCSGQHAVDGADRCPQHGSEDDEPTPAGDGQREALARHFMEWFGGEDQPVIDDYLAADAALAWFAARPSAPSVTTEQRDAAARDSWVAGLADDADLDGRAIVAAVLAALGIEVTP